MKTPTQKITQVASLVMPILLFLALLLAGYSKEGMMKELFLNGSYYVLLLLSLLWIIHINLYLKEIKFSFKDTIFRFFPGILLSFVITCVVFISVEPTFRILSDETNLLAVSKSMVYEKSVANATMGKYYYGNFNPDSELVPARPLFFQFCIHVLHVLLGYNPENIFLLNFLVLFAFLSCVYILARKYLDEASSLASMILIVAYPVVSISTSSGSYDMFSTVFFYLVFASLFFFLKDPTPAGFSFLWMNMLMFAHIRYESFIYFFLVLSFLLLFRVIRLELFKPSLHLFAMTPLLFLSLFWQRILSQGKYSTPERTSLFSVDQFMRHLKEMAMGQFDFSFELPYANIVNIIAVIIFLYLAWEGIARKTIFTKQYQRRFIFIFLAALAVNLTIFLSHFIGKYSHPTQAKFFLISSIACSLAPFLLKAVKPNAISGKALLLFSLVCFLAYHPIAVEGRFTNKLTLTRETKQCYQFLENLKEKNILIIANRPGLFTVLDYGVVNFSYANKYKNKVLRDYKRHNYVDIYVFQRISYDTGKPVREYSLDDDYNLEPLREIQVTAGRFLRISRVN